MFVLSWIPPLWFRIMDERLMALPHVARDLDRVNIDPRAAQSLFLKWGRQKMSEPAVTDSPST